MTTPTFTNLPTKNTNTLAWFLLIVLALIWGTSFFLIKQGLVVFSPIQIAAIRISSAFIMVAPWALLSLKHVPFSKIKLILLSGLLGMFFPAILFGYAQQHIPSSVAGVLNALTPAFTFIIAAVFLKRQVFLWQVVGLCLGFLGSLSLTLRSLSFSEGLQFNYYSLLVLLATFMYAVNANMVATHLKSIKPIYISTISIFLVGILAVIMFFITDTPTTLQKEGSTYALLAIVFLGLVSTAFATVLFNNLLQMTSVVFASSVTYLIPLVALFWGIIDGEQLLWGHYLGILCILLGIYLINRRR